MTPDEEPGRARPGPGGALSHGPWVAAAASLAVTPGALWLLSLLVERRRPRIREEFLAVVVGDPLLALAVAVGVERLHGRPPAAPAGPPYALAFAGGCLGFGLFQWREELRRGYFTREQALAPTKVWHQLVVYPVLGSWLWTSVVGGLAARGSAPRSTPAPTPSSARADLAARALIVAAVGGWAATNAYDRRHPKLGHSPFDWRRLRPRRRPWPAASTTLRAGR